MKRLSLHFIAICCLAAGLPSCVLQSKYQALEAQKNLADSRNAQLTEELDGCRQKRDALQNANKQYQQHLEATTDSIALLQNEQKTLSERYAALLETQKTLQSGARKEVGQLMTQLQQNREALQKKEDELAATERKLSERSIAIGKLETDLQVQQQQMQQQQERMLALENVLRQKDSVATALKKKVSDALLNFEGQGLTVHLRNGKVYVSMEEKLMFASGSFVVDKRGAAALETLTGILENNPDVSVLIEGHTDDVPYRGSGQLADNWDLSCKRATSVVRLLLTGSTVDASRISAAGRAEFVPLQTDKTPEARAANRRIEVVLSPKLDEVLKILEN
jgi:chemotaxis protein MotB